MIYHIELVPRRRWISLAAAFIIAGASSLYWYNEFRLMEIHDFGFSLARSLKPGVFALCMATIAACYGFVFVNAIPACVHLLRSQRRLSAGRCHLCGYDRRGSNTQICSECGEPFVQRASLICGRRTILTVAIAVPMCLCAVVGGIATAEGLILSEERAFEREVSNFISNGGVGMYARARRWPNGYSSLVYVPGRGCHGTD